MYVLLSARSPNLFYIYLYNNILEVYNTSSATLIIIVCSPAAASMSPRVGTFGTPSLRGHNTTHSPSVHRLNPTFGYVCVYLCLFWYLVGLGELRAASFVFILLDECQLFSVQLITGMIYWVIMWVIDWLCHCIIDWLNICIIIDYTSY